MSTADVIILVVFMAGTTLFGAAFYRKNRTPEAFTLGNRNLPGWVITLSIFATFVSSISYLALPGIAFQSDWNTFVFSLSIPVAALIAVRYFVPLYRRINSPSAYTFLEQRFGPWARIYAALCYLLTQLMRVGTILYLLALTLHTAVGWNMALTILVTGGAIMIYSMLGGLKAVVWTDAIQGLLLIAGILLTLGYIIIQLPGGPGQLISIAAAERKMSLGSFRPGLSTSTFWVVLVYGIFINLQNFGIDQNYIQRYMASRTDRSAIRSALWGGMLYIPVSFLFLLTGTSLYAFYAAGTATLPASLQDPSGADQVFPYFIVSQLPDGVSGLLLACIFAAGMSTISTSFNSSSTVFLTDFYKKRDGSRVDRRRSMQVLYLSSAAVTLIAMGIALAMINVRSALEAWWKLASIFSGGMLGLFLLGAFTRKCHQAEAVAGVITGLALIGWMSLSSLTGNPSRFGNPFHPYLTIVFGTLTIFMTGFLLTLLSGRRGRDHTKKPPPV